MLVFQIRRRSPSTPLMPGAFRMVGSCCFGTPEMNSWCSIPITEVKKAEMWSVWAGLGRRFFGPMRNVKFGCVVRFPGCQKLNRTSISHRVQGEASSGRGPHSKARKRPTENSSSHSLKLNLPALKGETSLDHLIGADTPSRQKSLSFGKVGRQECMTALYAVAAKGRTHGIRCGSNPDSIVDPNHQPLEVGAFWVEHVYGMVGGLVQSVQNTDRPSGLDGCGHNRVGKQGVVHCLAA